MEIEKEMDVEDSHILAKQRTKERELILDYDYKKCVGCSICVALCPKKALEEGPLQEIAKGLDAPPVLIDLDACAFCGMCANFCPTKAFRMTVKERTLKEEDANMANDADDADLAEAAETAGAQT